MHERMKTIKHPQDFDIRYGEPKTFQIESKTRVGMVPTSFSIAV